MLIGKRNLLLSLGIYDMRLECSFLQSCSVSICKRKLFNSFKDIVQFIPSDELPPSLLKLKQSKGWYYDWKQASFDYKKARDLFHSHFSSWLTNKIQLECFE